jgi:hypothetical protein
MPDAADPRTRELGVQLRVLGDPADELACRWLYRELSAHCRRDPDWQARIAELQAALGVNDHARALMRAMELCEALAGKP